MQEGYWIWSPVQLCLATHADSRAGHGLLPVPAPRFCQQSPEVAEGWGSSDCPLLCTAHLSLGSTVLAACCSSSTREVQAAPGKNREGFRSVQHVISHKRADSSHPPVSMKLWSKNQGHSQGSKTLHVILPSCHFSFYSGGSLYSCLFSTLLFFFLFPQQGGLLLGVLSGYCLILGGEQEKIEV